MRHGCVHVPCAANLACHPAPQLASFCCCTLEIGHRISQKARLHCPMTALELPSHLPTKSPSPPRGSVRILSDGVRCPGQLESVHFVGDMLVRADSPLRCFVSGKSRWCTCTAVTSPALLRVQGPRASTACMLLGHGSVSALGTAPTMMRYARGVGVGSIRLVQDALTPSWALEASSLVIRLLYQQ